ncbi:hypothetical protein [Novosphingobium album (ex Hu et al. 2023)]|uniref:Uncharacterized protein n=1 Tax=Novosphingobium album (ex Hu et al. 2023) TaxID=2930093 RepID=A0ABT0B0G3_9SPHN|nr:hypothetical protein [Novosphingobium album (ex Hu et al. 2023)]MCJ2178408.1 hypothetical protein [Novosphingobium album (ex Hu et al. 2023)]
MDDYQFDNCLRDLAGPAGTGDAGSEFHAKVWQRIGQMVEARDQRRRAVLGLAIFAVALGTGVGVTQSPAKAEGARTALADGTDLSPAVLLHVSP